MASDQPIEGSLKRAHLQRAIEPERAGNVVLNAASLQAIDYPDTTLRVGHRNSAFPGGSRNRFVAVAILRIKVLRELLDGGVLKQRANRSELVEGVVDHSDDLRRKQG